MFSRSCMANREAIYAVLAPASARENVITPAAGTGFAAAPGLLVTTARAVRGETDAGGPPRAEVAVIRAPDIGKKAETAVLLAVDPRNDIALLRIHAPRSAASLRMLPGPVPVGTPCGASGFPRIAVGAAPRIGVSLIELFQGGNISAFVGANGGDGDAAGYYETDSPMYGDASGCPGFVASGEVFGMHLRSVAGAPEDGKADGARPGVSRWMPSMEIIAFVKGNGLSPAP